MKTDKVLFDFSNGDILTIVKINADEKRKSFYASLGIFPGSTVTLFLRGKNGAVIKAGKTKLALAGRAASEIICGKMVNIYKK